MKEIIKKLIHVGLENSTYMAWLMLGVKQEINKYLKNAKPKDNNLI